MACHSGTKSSGKIVSSSLNSRMTASRCRSSAGSRASSRRSCSRIGPSPSGRPCDPRLRLRCAGRSSPSPANESGSRRALSSRYRRNRTNLFAIRQQRSQRSEMTTGGRFKVCDQDDRFRLSLSGGVAEAGHHESCDLAKFKLQSCGRAPVEIMRQCRRQAEQSELDIDPCRDRHRRYQFEREFPSVLVGKMDASAAMPREATLRIASSKNRPSSA